MNLLSSIVLSLALCLSTGAYASEFDDLKKVAEQGNAEAQNRLGVMYATGRGAPQNDREAGKWLSLAAGKGDRDAQARLGIMYRYGEGVVPQNYKEAVKWLRPAAKKGNRDAQRELGIMYRDGEGVPKNNYLAYVWFNLYSVTGGSNAKEKRDLVAEKLSPEDLLKAQELSQEYYEIIQGSQ